MAQRPVSVVYSSFENSMNAKQMIVESVKSKLIYAQVRHVEAQAKVAASIEGKKVWERLDPDDGVGNLSRCPYDVRREQENAAKAFKDLKMWEEAYELTINTFLED